VLFGEKGAAQDQVAGSLVHAQAEIGELPFLEGQLGLGDFAREGDPVPVLGQHSEAVFPRATTELITTKRLLNAVPAQQGHEVLDGRRYLRLVNFVPTSK
jgi:hypothetical protein